jgi:iron transport multicopper oxidase
MFKMRLALLAQLLFTRGLADTVTYNFDLGWKWLAPDGFGRPVIVVNGQWPPPTIVLDEGDRLVLHVTNNLGNETSSIHFHGLYQKDKNDMDGPGMATQCPIPPGSKFTYDFTVKDSASPFPGFGSDLPNC